MTSRSLWPVRVAIGAVAIVLGLVLFEHGLELAQGDPVNQYSCSGSGCPSPYYGEYLEMIGGLALTIAGAILASIRGRSPAQPD